ncbi:MAG: hypothetical protein M3R38_32700 [Actinomycetota bacterium]|nr:hypothetical protein [Actinomycetota bacterium]
MKPCRVCVRPEEAFISKLLRRGPSPRAICRRIGRTSRRSLTHYRERDV